MASRKTCIAHDKELLKLFCKECEVVVCPDCIENQHNKHEFVGVSSVADRHKQYLIDMLKKDMSYANSTVLEDRLDKALSELQGHSESLRNKIRTEKEMLVEKLNNSETDLLDRVRTLELKYGRPLSEMKIRLKQVRNAVKPSETATDISFIEQLGDIEAVALSEDLKSVFSATDESFDFHPYSFVFYKNQRTREPDENQMLEVGSIVEEVVALSDSEGKYMFNVSDTCDEVETFHDCVGLPDVLRSRHILKSEISNVTPRSIDSTLVLRQGKIYDMEGKINLNSELKPILVNVMQVKRSFGGEIYISAQGTFYKNAYECIIYRLLPDDRVVTLCNLGSCYNCCFGFTTVGGLAAFIIRRGSNYDPTTTSWVEQFPRQKIEFDQNGIVTKDSGRILDTCTYVNYDKFPSDIIVLDDGRSVVSFSRQICVYNSSLRTTLVEYTGVQGFCPRDHFIPNDMYLDIYGNILVADKTNNSVHVLDDNLKFIKFLVKEADGVYAPGSLSFDNKNCLWIGCESGNIFVIDYSTAYFSTKHQSH